MRSSGLAANLKNPQSKPSGMITKRCNHNCSGYLRCGFCNVLYSNNKQHLLEYVSATPSEFDTKTLATIINKYNSNKLEELQGQCGLPGILLDDLSQTLKDKGLRCYSKMLEFMHVLKGNIARTLSCFRMESSFDETKFSELANSEFRRHFTRRALTAADFRNMLIQCVDGTKTLPQTIFISCGVTAHILQNLMTLFHIS